MDETTALMVIDATASLLLPREEPRCKDGSSIDDLIEQFSSAKLGRTGSMKTFKAYLHTVRQFQAFLWQHKGMSLVEYSQDGTYDTIRIGIAEAARDFAFSSTHPGKIVSENTRNVRLSILTSFYQFAERNLKVPFANPLMIVERAKVEAYKGVENHIIEPTDLAAILAEIDRSTSIGKRDYALLQVLFHTGRRVNDVVTLTWGNVTVSRDGTVTLHFPHMKNNKTSTIPLEEDASAAVLDYLHDFYGSDLWRLPKDAPVWVNLSTLPGNTKQQAKGMNGYGSALTYQTVRNVFLTYFERGKVHMTRHTFAYMARLAGATIDELQELLDHSSVATTQIYDTHFDKQKNRKKHASKIASLIKTGKVS